MHKCTAHGFFFRAILPLQVWEVTMRVWVGVVCALAMSGGAAATESHRVKGYTKSDGTYVAPTRRTNPDGKLSNNYGSKPNVNPSSGRAGTIDPYKPKAPRAPKR